MPPIRSFIQAWIGNKLTATAALTLTLITLALWLPFGFRTNGLVEEWDLMSLGDAGANLFWLDSAQPGLSEYRIRPLLSAFFGLSYWIDPDSFIGINVILMALIAGKAMLLYGVLRRLMPAQPAVAWVGAALLIVYPGAQGLTLRAFGVHAALFFYLLAVTCLIAHWQNQRWIALVGAVLALIITANIYETLGPLILITPLILIWLEGRVTRRLLLVAAIWYAAPLFFGIRLLLILNTPAEMYHADMLQADNFDPGAALPVLRRVYRDHFVTGWLDAVTHLRFATEHLGFGAAILIGSGVAHWLHLKSTPDPIRVRRTAILLLIALAAVGAGFSAYSFFVAQRGRNALYYPLSGLGAAMVVAIAVHVLTMHRAWLAALLSGALIGIAAMDALWQHDRFVTLARMQQGILREIIEAVPAAEDGTCFVLIDQMGTTYKSEVFIEPGQLPTALWTVYNNRSLGGFLCHPGVDCRIEAEGITGVLEGRSIFCAYETVAAFSYERPGRVAALDEVSLAAVSGIQAQGYDLQAHISGGSPPLRASTMLEGAAQTPDQTAARLEFDAAELVIGSGWNAPEITAEGLTYRWTSAETAVLDFPLRQGTPYRLRFRVVYAIQPETLESLRVTANGELVRLASDSSPGAAPCIYEGTIPASALNRSATLTLALTIDRATSPAALGLNLDTRPMGIALDWLEIVPGSQSMTVRRHAQSMIIRVSCLNWEVCPM